MLHSWSPSSCPWRDRCEQNAPWGGYGCPSRLSGAHEHQGSLPYWDYYRQRAERNRGLRIDFVLGSPSFAERVTGAFIEVEERLDMTPPGPSDHAPVIVDIAD